MNSPAQVVMGFDYGHRKIGVAVGQTLTGTAQALATVPAVQNAPDWPRLEALIAEWKPQRLIIGAPLGPEGEVTPTSQKARQFGTALGERTGLPVEHWDERHSTQAARSWYKSGREQGLTRRKQAGQLDGVAARLMLEDWLRHQP